MKGDARGDFNPGPYDDGSAWSTPLLGLTGGGFRGRFRSLAAGRSSPEPRARLLVTSLNHPVT